MLDQALDAYKKALQSPSEQNNADLHLNFGIVKTFRFLENCFVDVNRI